jgi:O-acetyl-ADP-ribose deacetylase (regulator of RNase III)
MSITIHEGSILDVEADVVVNPANSHLAHNGGLARILDRAAQGDFHPDSDGPLAGVRITEDTQNHDARVVRRWLADNASAPLIATGDAYLTFPGLLPFSACVHAVGPVWGGGGFHERELLALAHSRALKLAEDAGFTSIAIPAISCGIFGFPVEQAAPIAVGICRATDLDVTFALMEDAHVAAYTAAIRNADQRRAETRRALGLAGEAPVNDQQSQGPILGYEDGQTTIYDPRTRRHVPVTEDELRQIYAQEASRV